MLAQNLQKKQIKFKSKLKLHHNEPMKNSNNNKR